MTKRLDQVMPEDKIQVQYYTEVKLLGGKSNSLQGKVRKLSTVFATATGQDTYKDRVGHQLFVEGKSNDGYKPKDRAWGSRVGNSPIIEHKGERYLEFIVEAPVSTVYMVEGKITDPQFIEGFPEPRERNEDSQGGVDKEIKIRCIKEENILSIVDLVTKKKVQEKVSVTIDIDLEFYDNGTPVNNQIRKETMRKLKELGIENYRIPL